MRKILPPPPPPHKRLTALVATLAALIALPMTTHAQTVGFVVCPSGIAGTINPRYITIEHGDTKTYPSWFTRATPATTSNAVTVTVSQFGLDQVNAGYPKDGGHIFDLGTATSASYLLGLVDGDGNLVHGFYDVLGFNTQTVPAQTVTFHSLQPGTRYAVTVFVDDVKGETEPARLPVVAKRPLFRNCVETAS